MTIFAYFFRKSKRETTPQVIMKGNENKLKI